MSEGPSHPPVRPSDSRRADTARPAWRDHVYGGTQLAVSVLLGLFAGYYFDKRWECSPWLMLLGATLGLAVGLYSFLKPYLAGNGPK